MQEVLLAPQIYVLCADSYMFVMWHSWEDLRNEAINGQVFGPGSSVAWLFRSRKREALSPTYHIGDVVRRFADMKCQDPRDKIYGFLGLIPEAKRPVVDYNKSIMEVFLDSVSLLSEGGWGDTLRSTSHIQRIIERTSLCFKLADAMGLPNLDGLHEFFQNVHHTEHRLSLEQDRSIDDIPKIEIHFEATSVDCDPSKTNGRFWFEYHGQRHYQVPTGMFRTSATDTYAAVQHDDVPLNWGRSNNLHDAQRFARFADLPQGSRNALSQYDPTWS